MAIAWFVIDVAEDENDRERRSQFHRFYRNLRDSSNPFEMPNRDFLKLFRLNKKAAQFVINEILPHLEAGVKITAIKNYLKVLCALHFMGQGSYQTNVGSNAFLGMRQPSVSRCILRVCQTIVRNFLNQLIKFPGDRRLLDVQTTELSSQCGWIWAELTKF